MKYEFEELMEDALHPIEAGEEFNQRLMAQLEGNVVPIRRRSRGKRVAAAAVLFIAMCGGVTAVDAATGGHIQKAIHGFFESESYRNGEKVETRKYQNEEGLYVMEEGGKEFTDDLNEALKEDWTGADGMGAATYYLGKDEKDKNEKDKEAEKATVVYSTDDSEYFKYSVGSGEEERSAIIGFGSGRDNSDKGWQVRSHMVNDYFNTFQNEGQRTRYLSHLEELAENVDKPYLKEAILAAVGDCRAGKHILITEYPVQAYQAGIEGKNPEDYVDTAWFIVDVDKLEFKNNRAVVTMSSTAGYEMVGQLVVEKQEDGSYIARKIDMK